MRRVLSEREASEVNINPAVRNDGDYTSDINEAINSPLSKRFLFRPHIIPMVCQKRLVSLVTEAATLLVDVTEGRRRRHL
jgi:hypothetical protein